MILRFRSDQADHPRDDKRFAQEKWMEAVISIYREDILAGKTRTRQSMDGSLAYFLRTKSKNLRDYADACFRYLRFSGLMSVSFKGHSLSILEDRLADADFILERVSRDPAPPQRYLESLFDARQPALYADQKENAAAAVLRISSYSMADLSGRSVEELKELREQAVRQNQAAALSEQVRALISHALYSEVVALYGGQAKIIPLDLSQFMLLIDHAYNYAQTPEPEQIRGFLDSACACADTALDELDWADRIDRCVHDWLT